MTEEIKSRSVDEDLIKLDIIYDSGEKKKSKALEILDKAMDKIEINPNGNSELLTAQISLVNTYVGVVESQEKAIKDKVGTKIKQKDSESTSSASAAVVEVLNKMQLGNFTLHDGVGVDNASKDSELTASMDQLKNNNAEMASTIEDFEKRTDSKDMS